MKKIISFFTLVLITIGVNAQVESVYLQDCTVQAGAKAVIKVMVTHDTSKGCIGSMQFNYSFDDGIVVRDNGQDVVGVGATTVNDKTNFVLLGGMESTTAAAPDGACVCVFNIDIPADMALGEHPMSISNIMAVYEDGITAFELDHVESTLTVQKSAVINAMPEGFAVTVSPFVAWDGDITLHFRYKSPVNIKNLSFDVQTPGGIFFIDDDEWDSANVTSTLTASCTGAPTLSHEIADGYDPTSATIKVAGTYNAKSQKFINASTDYSPLATMSACVLTPDNYFINDWDFAVMEEEGVYTIKLSNIVLEDIDGNKYTGEYLASVIYGQPEEQEVILYGYYDEATANAFTTALKNVAIANTTGAKFGDALIKDVILNDEKSNSSFYTRTSDNYGTTVLPYDLESTPNCQLYMVMDMTSEGIVIKETDYVAANTPCIFKGDLCAYTDNGIGVPAFCAITEQSLGMTTFKGTYEATSIASGEGYYIASNGKFYNDGASIRPFRGYFDGTIAGVKSLRVLLDDATGLIDITDQFSKEDIYNLQGIRMNNVQKGINIKGGKKVLVK